MSLFLCGLYFLLAYVIMVYDIGILHVHHNVFISGNEIPLLIGRIDNHHTY